MPRRSAPPRLPAGPPASAEEGAQRIKAALIKLFDPQDGGGANWRLMAESLYLTGFQLADERLDAPVRHSLMQRVHEGSYRRLSDDSEASKASAAAQRSKQTELTGLLLHCQPCRRPPFMIQPRQHKCNRPSIVLDDGRAREQGAEPGFGDRQRSVGLNGQVGQRVTVNLPERRGMVLAV